ncbi:MAG: DnaA regulatory inactivator HdaA [Acetobacteraceae bacterium]
MAETRQLPLVFPHTPHFVEGDFLPGPGNRQALEFLANTPGWPQGRLAIWGGRGAGKTHLLHIWARERGASIVAGAALQEPVWPEGPTAVDDADRVPSELALLHLLNAACQAGYPLLLTASRPPSRLPVRLPDLASRLRATAAVEIGPADEAFLTALLTRLLAARQLPVSPALQAWLLTRLPRTQGAVQEAVARLDQAALAAGTGVTRTLAVQALADLLDDEAAVPAPHFSPPGAGFG